jgi:hypothetical protein
MSILCCGDNDEGYERLSMRMDRIYMDFVRNPVNAEGSCGFPFLKANSGGETKGTRAFSSLRGLRNDNLTT